MKENQSLIPLTQERVKQIIESDNPFPIDFDIAWNWIGYATKGSAKRQLVNPNNKFTEGIDYQLTQVLNSAISASKSTEEIFLTQKCFKKLCMLSRTEKGDESREYFVECETKLKHIHQQQKELTPAEAFLESAQLLVEIEKKQKLLESGLKITNDKIDEVANEQQRLLGERDYNLKKLFEIQRSQVLPLQKSCKALLKQLVDAYVKSSGLAFAQVWTKLYDEFDARYNTKVRTKAKNRNVTTLDYIESILMMEPLFSIASHILVIAE